MQGEFFILVILIILSAFFSGAEVALVSVSMVKVRRFLDEKRRGAGALNRLKKSPKRMIITILIGNNIANIAAASMATLLATEAFGSRGFGIATGIMTLIILLFGEITPKTFATSHAPRISLVIAQPVEILSYLLYPLVKILEWFSDVVNRIVKMKKIESISEAEVKTMIQLGVEHQVLEPEEKAIMEKAMRFSDIKAADVMTRADEMFSVNSDLSIKQSLPDILRSGFSRIPIYKNVKTNIVGVVLVKDILKHVSDKNEDKKLMHISSEPLKVTSDTGIDDLLKSFQKAQTHIGFVTKDHRIIGIATLEDLLEELVGEITDESEVIPNRVISIGKDTIITHGNTYVTKINFIFHSNLPYKSEKDTLYDLFLSHGGSHKKGSSVLIKDISLTVDDIRGEKIVMKVTKEKLAVSLLNRFFKKLILGRERKSK